jgi:hypothetical protein
MTIELMIYSNNVCESSDFYISPHALATKKYNTIFYKGWHYVEDITYATLLIKRLVVVENKNVHSENKNVLYSKPLN